MRPSLLSMIIYAALLFPLLKAVFAYDVSDGQDGQRILASSQLDERKTLKITPEFACLKYTSSFQCPNPTEPCMDEGSHYTCLRLITDGCKNICVFDTCPFQFQCRDDDANIDSFKCPPVNSRCMNKRNHARCQRLVDNGCSNVITPTRVCPFKFQCGDTDIALLECPLPSTRPCANEESYASCQKLKSDGCSKVAMNTTCPLQFHCLDFVCPGATATCMNEMNHGECQKLVDGGCVNVLSPAKVCPLEFKCGDKVDTPVYFCPSPLTDPCVDAENNAVCQNLVASGCISIATTKSCPMQFFCTDAIPPP